MLDYDTVAVGDKFGNFSVLRLPSEVSEAIDDDPVASRVLYEKSVLNGAAYKVRRCGRVAAGTGRSLTPVRVAWARASPMPGVAPRAVPRERHAHVAQPLRARYASCAAP